MQDSNNEVEKDFQTSWRETILSSVKLLDSRLLEKPVEVSEYKDDPTLPLEARIANAYKSMLSKVDSKNELNLLYDNNCNRPIASTIQADTLSSKSYRMATVSMVRDMAIVGIRKDRYQPAIRISNAGEYFQPARAQAIVQGQTRQSSFKVFSILSNVLKTIIPVPDEGEPFL